MPNYLEVRNFQNMSADEWYQVDAIRSVNQSIGRVLRHKDDFGVVILVDSRSRLVKVNSR